jgi:hypothetical protein
VDGCKPAQERWRKSGKTQLQPFRDFRTLWGEEDGCEARIAIVLGAVSIVADARWLVQLSAALTVLAALLALNGFFLVVEPPLE